MLSVAAITRDRDAFARLDRAYLTTAAAAEVQQELAIQDSLARAAAGKVLRSRLQIVHRDVVELAKLATAKVAVGTGGLTVPCF